MRILQTKVDWSRTKVDLKFYREKESVIEKVTRLFTKKRIISDIRACQAELLETVFEEHEATRREVLTDTDKTEEERACLYDALRTRFKARKKQTSQWVDGAVRDRQIRTQINLMEAPAANTP